MEENLIGFTLNFHLTIFYISVQSRKEETLIKVSSLKCKDKSRREI